MRLLVVSHTPHYLDPVSGQVVGWGATVRELDHLATLFGDVVHLAPLHDEPPPASSRPYAAANLRLRPLAPSGGVGVAAKLGILARAPAFFTAFRREVRRADAVHVRAPANVALLALASRRLVPARPWWVKYAGNWRPEGETAAREARSYRLQRAWLRRDRGWAVTVNGRWPDQPSHVTSFLNPCLEDSELARARGTAEAKILDQAWGEPLRLLFVGRLDEAKGAARALETAARLDGAVLEVAGDGPDRAALESRARSLGVETHFHGWLDRPRLDQCYRRAHVLLLPSLASEGWPKVVSEAMAWGVVPVTSDVSALPSILGELAVGAAVPARDVEAVAAAVRELTRDTDTFRAHGRRAASAADAFTYGRYLDAVRALFAEHLRLELPAAAEV